VLVDDLIATGGTAIAGFELVESLGATVVEFAAVVCLPGLGGVGAIYSHENGRYKDIPILTLVDDATIGAENCRDPPAGTPRLIRASEAGAYASVAALSPGRVAPAPAAGSTTAAPVCSVQDSPEKIAQILQHPTAPVNADGSYAIKVGIIGGSGLDDPDIMKDVSEVVLSTPFGKPSDSLLCGQIAGVPCVLIARHGRQHTIMPSNVNYRANSKSRRTTYTVSQLHTQPS
jgi:hypothetical protein